MIFKELNENEANEYREWSRENHRAGDLINEVWHPVVRAECAKINCSIEDTDFTHLQGGFNMPYAELVRILGKPNRGTDGYKTDAEWMLNYNDVVATIYNYKNGPNYTGEGTIEGITEWNIGGRDIKAAAVVQSLINQ